eukprot:scaffold10996_cov90-Isochrysis_galbana.AAC.8
MDLPDPEARPQLLEHSLDFRLLARGQRGQGWRVVAGGRRDEQRVLLQIGHAGGLLHETAVVDAVAAIGGTGGEGVLQRGNLDGG